MHRCSADDLVRKFIGHRRSSARLLDKVVGKISPVSAHKDKNKEKYIRFERLTGESLENAGLTEVDQNRFNLVLDKLNEKIK